MKNLKNIVTFIFLGFTSIVFSQQLTYKPMNPFFGGETFNYQQMLAEANAQNDFTGAKNGLSSESTSDLESFTDGLNRQLLSSISQELFKQQLGDQTLSVGTFVFGTLVVDVSPSNSGLVVNILDTTTGDQTQIIIPN